MNSLRVFNSDQTFIDYSLKAMTYAQFLNKISNDFPSSIENTIYYIDHENEEANLDSQEQFDYIKNQMKIKGNLVKVFFKSENPILSSIEAIKETVLKDEGRHIAFEITQKTSLLDLYQFYERELNKRHFTLSYQEDGDDYELGRNNQEEWKQIKHSQENPVCLSFEFENVPKQKNVIFKCPPNRKETVWISEHIEFIDIKKILFDKFNKENFSLEYTNSQDGEIYEIYDEMSWEEFKAQSYDLEEVEIKNAPSNQEIKVRILIKSFKQSESQTSYTFRKGQQFQHFCTTFVEKKIHKINYSIAYQHAKVKNQLPIEDQEDWQKFMDEVFKTNISYIQIRDGHGALKKTQKKSVSKKKSEKNEEREQSQEKIEQLLKQQPIFRENKVEQKKNIYKIDLDESKSMDEMMKKKMKILNNSQEDIFEHQPIKKPEKNKKLKKKLLCPSCSEERKQVVCFYCRRCQKYVPIDHEESQSEEEGDLENLFDMFGRFMGSKKKKKDVIETLFDVLKNA